METSGFSLSISSYLILLSLVVLVVFNFILRKNLRRLQRYVDLLKEKIKKVNQKLNELTELPDLVNQLLRDTAETIKTSYQDNFGNKIEDGISEEADLNQDVIKDKLNEKFLYLLAYQSLKAEITALENTNSAEHTWSNIHSQMKLIFEPYLVINKSDFEKYVEGELHQRLLAREEPDETKKKKQHEHFYTLLQETLAHVQAQYQEKFGHEIGQIDHSIEENNSTEHFLLVLGFQTLKAELTALDNSNSADKTWDKISAQLSVLIDNYRIIPEKEYEIIIKESVQQVIEKQSTEIETGSEGVGDINRASIEASESENIPVADSQKKEQYIMLDERKSEINRLKDQLTSQFDEIRSLQSDLASKLNNGSDSLDNDLSISDSMALITRQLKDAELCITMMDDEISAQQNEINTLKEQLDSKINSSNIPAGSSADAILNEIKAESIKKDQLIKKFTQESKEMMTLIEGMEKNEDEMYLKVKALEEQLEAEKSKPEEQTKQTVFSSNDAVVNEIKAELIKKEQIVEKFTQESKEMMTIIEGMENNEDELYQKIKTLEEQLLKNTDEEKEKAKKKDRLISRFATDSKNMMNEIAQMQANEKQLKEKVKQLEEQIS